jgi:hypothetical protein
MSVDYDPTPRDVDSLPLYGMAQRVCVHTSRVGSRRIVGTGEVTEIQPTLIGTFVYRVKGHGGYIEEARLSPERAGAR